MDEEARPTLPLVPGIDLDDYENVLLERFTNPAIADTLARLCAESSDRIPKWVLPIIRENLNAGRSIALGTAIVASWARYAEGVDERGRPIPIVDPLRDRLTPLAQAYEHDELAFISDRSVFGDLIDEPRFTEPYRATLKSLHDRGAAATLERILS
jgi:mannitol 2-dehydrogenase